MKRRLKGLGGMRGLLAACWFISASACATPQTLPPPSPLTGFLGSSGDDQGFSRVTAPRAFDFPTDHGPHRGFRNEWWYFSGQLESSAGERFGFQLTFFRFGLAARGPARTSPWASDELYLAHFALTDVAAGEHRAVERLSRAAVGLAGARSAPFAVWVNEWSARSVADAFLPMRLAAGDAENAIALDLQLGPGKRVVAQGDAGMSRKGPQPGNASYYYSLTRLPAVGAVDFAGHHYRVTGMAWLDREWGTSSLPPGVIGWDWFGLQLADGRELMCYRLRDAQGHASAYSSGSVVAVDGTVRHLAAEDFSLLPLQSWTSPRHLNRYPVRWRLTIPASDVDVIITTAVNDQEQDLTVRYWEGTVDMRTPAGALVGRGYMELTGY